MNMSDGQIAFPLLPHIESFYYLHHIICAKTLIFGSFFFIAFLSSFFPPLFAFFDLAFYCIFSFFNLVFYCPLFSPFFFCSCSFPVFLAHMVPSLAYPDLLGNKMLGCCCYCIFIILFERAAANNSIPCFHPLNRHPMKLLGQILLAEAESFKAA
jgi:hypothetical protein